MALKSKAVHDLQYMGGGPGDATVMEIDEEILAYVVGDVTLAGATEDNPGQ